ncbi:MAG TPA: MBOAT family protein [Kofleriaceae bacterium]|nr:MBOAT family protein [Kofleriaceae bacterium]
MPFSSVLFVHLFLPAFLVVYWITPRPGKNGVAITASLLFYAWGAPKFLPVVLGLGVVDYYISHAIGAARGKPETERRARVLLLLGVGMHLSVLAYFKYSNFFADQINSLLAALGAGELHWTQVVLPIGISFITFEEISYLCDVYRGDAKPARRISHYVLFLTLFPHSIAGPIFRWKDLERQFAERDHSVALVRAGFERFAIGLAKKVLLADSVAIIADGVFALQPDQVTTSLAWLGAIAYAVQIYFDFSGYSDMAIGLGWMIGFRFKENFNRPYVSASFTEFWTRWHISLSSWLRDYLYIPLGGNRRGPRRALINLVIVFLLSGLWHGAAWTFVLWGAYHGLFVAIERLLGERRARIPLFAQHVSTLALVVVGWVFFRAASAGQAFDLIAAMFGAASPTSELPLPPPALLMPRFSQLALLVGIAISLVPIVAKYVDLSAARARIPAAASVAARLGIVLLFVLSAMHLTNMRITPLIYFKF